ncbi:hypothetical protein [Paenibacillus gansuensis]|uniref:Tail length tape measure protein n=1 Tax=Paenibacillus gansuensis TaxID=306542 RepID=A0ABW5PGQ8_9BACL
MPTIQASMDLYDRFSSKLQAVNKVIQKTVELSSQLQKAMGNEVKLSINTGNAIKQAEKVKQKLEQAGDAAVRLPDVNKQAAAALRNTKANKLQLQVQFDSASAIRQASQLRADILNKLRNLVAQVELKVNAQLSGIMGHVSASMDRLVSAMDKLAHIFNRGNRTGDSGDGGGAISAFGGVGGIAAIVTSVLAAMGLQQLWQGTVGGAMEQQQTLDTFSARAGSEALGGAIFDKISKQALDLGQNVDAALSGSMSFMSNTMNPEKLEKLSKLSMRLAKLNKDEGVEGAAFAMKELLSGDYASIVERFNIGRGQIKGSQALEAGKKGDMDGFITGMDKLLNQQNMTEAAFMKMLDSPAAKWEKVIETFKFQLKQAGSDALTALEPLFDFIIKAFDEGRFAPFFKVLSAGLWVVSNLMYGAARAAMFFGDLFIEYWPIIAGVLGAIAYIYLPILIRQLYAMLVPIYQQVAAWAYLNWPILLVGAAIGGLVYWLLKMGVTAQEMVGVVTGAFYTLAAFIYNKVALLYNVFASFAEFLINVFIDPMYAIKKLFYDLSMTFLSHMYTMSKGAEDFAGNFMTVVNKAINMILGGVNFLINGLNNVPGFGNLKPAKLIDEKNIHAVSGNIKAMMNRLEAPTTDKKVLHIARMQEMDLKGSFDNGYRAGAGIVNKVSKALDGFKLPGGDATGKGDIPNVGKVGEVGKIKDKVDISSEDLKIMRDLAEMKAIQNFVTLQPTTHVTTGPIYKEVDVDEVIQKIVSDVEQGIAASASGHYTRR